MTFSEVDMKRVLRSAIVFILSATMVGSLVSCKSGQSGSDKDQGGGDKGTRTSQSQEAKFGGTTSRVVSESDPYFNVNASELKVNIPSGKEIEYSMCDSAMVAGNRIFASVAVQFKMPPEVEKEMNTLNLDNEKQAQRYMEIQSQYYSSSIQIFDLDGKYISEMKLENEAQFRNAYAGNNGEIIVVTEKMETLECAMRPFVFVINENGEKIRDINFDIKEPLQGMCIYMTEDGKFLLSSDGKLFVMDQQGREIASESDAGLSGMMCISNGKWYAIMPEMNSDEPKFLVQEVDVNTGKLVGEKIKTSDKVMRLMQGEKDCFYMDNNGIQKYDVLTDKCEPILSWSETDLNHGRLRYGGEKIFSENEMVFFQNAKEATSTRASMDKKGESSGNMLVLHLTKADKNPHAGKQILKVGVNGVSDPTFIDEVIKFNTSSDQSARVVLYDYNPDEPQAYYLANTDDESTSEGVNSLTLDLLSGEGPDILIGFSDVKKFNNENTLVDLKSKFESDSEIKKEDYFESVVHAFEEDGKLFQIPITYMVDGMAINKKVDGAKENLTFADFEKIASTLPDNMQMYYTSSYDKMLNEWMNHLSSHFIDNENKKVSFDSEEFKTLLETVKKYGYVKDKSDDPEGAIFHGEFIGKSFDFRNGLIATCIQSFSSLEDFASMEYSLRNIGIVYSGVPSSEGMGMSASGKITMAITTSAKDTDACWSFLRNFLKEDVQQNLSFETQTLPVNRNAFKTNCDTEIKLNKEVLKDAQEVRDLKGEMDLLELKPEHVDMLIACIEKITQSTGGDTDVWKIVSEEAAGYFAGSRTVEDVCRNIQDRASKIVQER